MKRISAIVAGAVVAWAGAGEVEAQPAARDGGRPNILFIFSDDHANHAISAYGSKINRTPHIDRIAREGMLFRNCLVPNSICTPSRATVLTGKHSHINGTYNVGDRFDGGQQTFPKLLQRAGYQTAIVGKWHLGHGGNSDPSGFDYWNILIGQGPYYNPPMIDNGRRVEHAGYTTDVITDLSLDWLKNRRDSNRPFMLMCQHKAPHRAWDPGPEHLSVYDDREIPEPDNLFDDYANRASPARTQEMQISRDLTEADLKFIPARRLNPEQKAAWDAAYGPKNRAFKEANLTGQALVRWKYQRYIKDYLRCIASVDDNIGRLLRYLDESGLAENTIVIYSSDQGFYLGDHGWYDKRFMYEESLKTPLVVRWPGAVKPGSESADLVSNLDFAQTFLEIAGAPQPSDMQGRSLVPIMKGQTPGDWRKSFYYHYYDFPAEHAVQRHYGVRTDRYKLIHFYDIKEWELFDLKEDPREMRSVYADPKYAGIREELEKELKRLQELYGETDPGIPASDLRQQLARRHARDIPVERVLRLDALTPERVKAAPTPNVASVPFTVGALCTPEAADGVIIAQGGVSSGYSLFLRDGRPTLVIRNRDQLWQVQSTTPLPPHQRAAVIGLLTPDGRLRLLVDGRPAGDAEGRFLERFPAEGFCVGEDAETAVGNYGGPMKFQGKLEDVRVYRGVPDDAELTEWARN